MVKCESPSACIQIQCWAQFLLQMATVLETDTSLVMATICSQVWQSAAAAVLLASSSDFHMFLFSKSKSFLLTSYMVLLVNATSITFSELSPCIILNRGFDVPSCFKIDGNFSLNDKKYYLNICITEVFFHCV